MQQTGLNLTIKKSIFPIILLVLLLVQLPFSAAYAVVVDNIYEAEIPVADQSRQARRAVFEQAFQQMLIRVVGNSDVLGNPLIDEARRKASRYVSKFLYREVPREPVTLNGQPSEKPEGHLLWIKFDAQAVNSLLSNSNLPVWGKQRPEVLVWLAVRDGNNRYILRDIDTSPIKDAVEEAARLRGLPIRWPRYDESEKARLSYVDLWGGFWDSILAVSRHYQKEAILVGRYQWSGGQWQARWDMLTDRHDQNWQLSSTDLLAISGVGIDPATDIISAKYALVLKEKRGGNFYIDVHGIGSTDDYAAVSQYLLSLNPIKDVSASEISPLGVRFKIDAIGGVDTVRRLIKLGSTLRPDKYQVTTQLPLPDDVVLAYRLQ